MRRASVVAVLLSLGAAALASAGEPGRAWTRGASPPLQEHERFVDVPVPRGLCRFRIKTPLVGPGTAMPGLRDNGPIQFVCELLPNELLPPLRAIPQEKHYKDLLDKERWDSAVENLDKVLRDPQSGSLLVRPPWESEVWTSLHALARERLRRLPGEARVAYRNLRDNESAALFDAALESGSPWELVSLVDRFPVATKSGPAVARAGDLFFERGELALARRSWERALSEFAGEVDAAAISSRIQEARLLEHAHAREEATAAVGSFASPLRLTWRRPVCAPPRSLGSPLPGIVARAEGSLVFFQEEDGVSAVELETGRLRWRTQLERGPRWPDDDAPATVALSEASGDPVVAVRGRRLVFFLDRTNGQVLARVDLVSDLQGARDDRIDAAESRSGRVFLAAKIGNDRVAIGLDAKGSPVFRTVLWGGGSYDAALSAESGRLMVFADGGLASLDFEGEVRWLRVAYPRDAGLSPERSLARAGERVLALDRAGLSCFVAETGTREAVPHLELEDRPPAPPRAKPPPRFFDCPLCGATSPTPGNCARCRCPLVEREPAPGERISLAPLGSATLVLAAGEDGPILLEERLRSSLVPLVAIENGRARVLRLLERKDLPAFPGVVSRGRIFLATDDSLIAFGLASGEEAGRARVPAGPGRLASAGETILVSQDRQLLAFAAIAPGPLPRKLPDDANGLAARLSAGDFREREVAYARLRLAGEAALPALREALVATTSNAEGRDGARALVREIEGTRSWKAAFPELKEAALELLVSPRSKERIAGLSQIPEPRPAGAGEAELLSPEAASALERAARDDEDISMRAAALRLHCRYSKKARESVASVLVSQEKLDGSVREAAAELLVTSSLVPEPVETPDPAPPRACPELAQGARDVRAGVREIVFLACLRSGGPTGPGHLLGEATPTPQDPALMRAIQRWTREQGMGVPIRGGGGLPIPESRGLEQQENERALLEKLASGEKSEKPR